MSPVSFKWAHSHFNLFLPMVDFRYFFSGYRAFIAQSRVIPNLQDSLLFHGITYLRNKVVLLGKALVMGNLILYSRADMTIDIIGQKDVEVA
jgi:hypothetical protein